MLIIYGTADIPTWEESVSDILLRHLNEDPAIDVIPEFLNLVQASKEKQRLLAESLQIRYADTKFDLLVAVSGEPNSFINEWSSLFAPDVPIVHVLPGSDVAEIAKRLPDRALVLSAIETAFLKSLELLPSVVPAVEQFYLLAGSGDGDRDYLSRFENVLQEVELHADVQYLIGTPVDELITMLGDAPATHAILMGPYNSDNNGTATRTVEVIRTLSENLNLPIFAFSGTSNRAGGIGGNSTSGPAYAQNAIDLIDQILAGDPIPQLPMDSATEYVFNGEQLDRFNIDRSVLPPGSRIENETPSFWRQYRAFAIGGILVFAAQLALIALLLGAIRKRKLAEIELEKVHKMEALGSLAGGIAHDFNNILMSIVANAELAKMSAKDSVDKTLKKLSDILTASDRAKSLISQILMFSRQTNKSDFKKLSLTELVDESVGQVRAFLPKSCVVLTNIEENIAPIEGDSTQLQQVILNICVNAQHAIGSTGGKIEIDLKNLKLKSPQRFLSQEIPAGKYIALSFKDNGAGMDEDVLSHIFEPFYTTKVHGQGTGLGLTLVYRIVKTHKGYINIESTAGQGTVITLYFPAKRRGKTSNPAKLSPGLSHGHNEMILLVDDDEMVLDATRNIIEEIGYTVETYSSSVAALETFRSDPDRYQLVVSDLSMPEMDGVRLISNIRELRPKQPIILCSGYSDGLKSIELKNVQILNKPFSASELSYAIARTLGDKKSLRTA